MMLPEHREAFIQRRKDWVIRERADVDEQERARWAEQLSEAMEYRTMVQVTVWERHHERVWSGRVRTVDVVGARFQLEQMEERDSDVEVHLSLDEETVRDCPVQRVWINWEQMIALRTCLCDDDR
jgi:YolD-like protein